jgi:hypothetical protein
VETSPCQRVRTDFARKIFGKLFVGGFARIWRLFPIPSDSRAGHFDDRRLGTVGRTSRVTVMRRNSYLHVNVGGMHSIKVMVAITAQQQKRGLPLYFTAADSIRILEVALIAGSVLDVSTTELRC